MAFPWFRFYSEAINDRKLARVAQLAELSKCEAIGAWAILLALANDSPGELRGWLYLAPGYPLGLSDLAEAWAMDEAKAGKALGAFESLGLIKIHARGHPLATATSQAFEAVAWEGRQFLSDSSTKRTRAYRQRQKEAQEEKDRRKRKAEYKKRAREQREQEAQAAKAAGNVTETSQGSHSDAPEQNRTDSETEQNRTDFDLQELWDNIKPGLKLLMTAGGYGALMQQAKPHSLDGGNLVISMPHEPNPRLAITFQRALKSQGLKEITDISFTVKEVSAL